MRELLIGELQHAAYSTHATQARGSVDSDEGVYF